MPKLLWYACIIHGNQCILVTPLVSISVDVIVTPVSLHHLCLPDILVCPHFQSVPHCHSYSGIPEPSTVTSIIILVYPLLSVSVDVIVTLVSLDHSWFSIYRSTPLVRESLDARVILVSLNHPLIPEYTGLPLFSEYPSMP